MARSRSERFVLADLVALVLICGLIVAFFRSLGGQPDATPIFLVFVVILVWGSSQAKRKALPCEECGRPFFEPRKAPDAIACPQCGHQPRLPTRSVSTATKIVWALLGLLGVLVVVIGFVLADAASSPPDVTHLVLVLALIASFVVTMLVMLSVGLYRSYPPVKTRELTCEACGTIIPREPVHRPGICPRCRQRHLSPDEARKANARGWNNLLIVLTIGGILVAAMFWGSAGTPFGLSPWVGIPILVLISIVSVYLAMIVILVLVSGLRIRKLRSEPGAIAMARKIAGEEGEVVKQGPTTIWYSGPIDPVPMLREAMEDARRRFGELLGESEVAEPSVRILCFHDRGAFLRFHTRLYAGLDFSGHDALYISSLRRLLTLCTAQAPCRVTQPERTARSAYAYALVEADGGLRPPVWLQYGLYGAVDNGGDPAGSARLNRKMMASLSLGTAFSTELLTVSSNEMARWLRGTQDPRNWQKCQQFVQQSWSIVEYLRDNKGSGEARSRLGAFVRDPRSKTHQEDSFRLHFGYGFGPLLDGWRQWVLDRGIGRHEPPAPPIRDGLLNRVLPVVRDRQARRGDRILAIRELGNAGFVLGADVLIEMLRESDDISKEIVWALSMISGMAWGDDPDRWQAWLDDLPMTWTDPQPDGLETELPAPIV